MNATRFGIAMEIGLHLFAWDNRNWSQEAAETE
jgi:hypothetical protein